MIFLVSCTSHQKATLSDTAAHSGKNDRTPSAVGRLTGDYLGEGLFQKNRTWSRKQHTRPAVRFYLDLVPGEADMYYGVLVEYPQLLKMAPPYVASQKAPFLNHIFGYLNRISTQISAFKLVPGPQKDTYEMRNLEVKAGQIVASSTAAMTLTLKSSDPKKPLAGATITGHPDGDMVFPDGVQNKGGLQYKLAKKIYEKGKLASTWRGNWSDLEGSYLSAYGNTKDGVLELYSHNGGPRAKFIKTNRTKPEVFTNRKSATIEGEYIVTEPIPKMYLLTPAEGTNTPSDIEMSGRIGLFLDVFDGSAPAAGNHLVTELAFSNPQDPKDFMMYYEDINHAKNVGVEPPRK